MAIEFFNVNTGERRTITRAHQVGAFINSSDLGENKDRGQDFGWRIAPEQMVKVEELKSDSRALRDIAERRGIAVQDLKVLHLVQYLSEQEELESSKNKLVEDSNGPKFQDKYEEELRALKKKKADQAAAKKAADKKSDSDKK